MQDVTIQNPTRIFKGLSVRFGDRASKAALIVLLIVFVGGCLRTAWLGDDAHITFRTVDNFVNGRGLTWNTAERVEVYTHPLWMLLFSGLYFITRETYLTAIFFSIALSLLAVLLFAFRVARTPALAILGVVMLIRSHAFIDYCTSGLENPLTYLCLAAFFAVYFGSQEITPKKLFFLSLVASLGTLNRMDTFLLYAPVLAYGFWKCRCFKAVFALFFGFLPFILWKCFSLAYYGFLFPNTAYAKLNTGVAGGELVVQGARYFLHSLKFDPLTLLAIGCGIVASLCERKIRHAVVAAGAIFYLAYIIRIGGDFMGGRFFAAPFFCAVVLISRSTLIKSKPHFLAAFSAAVFIGLLSAEPSFLLSRNGIMNTRLNYYSNTGLLRPKPTGWINYTLEHEWANEGMRTRKLGTAVVQRRYIGMFGFYAGPRVHIVDLLALTDPLLARLPARYAPRWGIGHFERVVPEGYIETIRTGENKIVGRTRAAYYDKLTLLTRGPLFSRERWNTIWNLNIGKYDHLIDFERYRFPDLVKYKLSHTTDSNEPLRAEMGGAEIDLGFVTHADTAEIVTEHPVDFRIEFLNGDNVVCSRTVLGRESDRTGPATYSIGIVRTAAAKGYEKLRIFPLVSNPACLITRVRLADDLYT